MNCTIHPGKSLPDTLYIRTVCPGEKSKFSSNVYELISIRSTSSRIGPLRCRRCGLAAFLVFHKPSIIQRPPYPPIYAVTPDTLSYYIIFISQTAYHQVSLHQSYGPHHLSLLTSLSSSYNDVLPPAKLPHSYFSLLACSLLAPNSKA